MSTFAELYSQDHTLGLYCTDCDRWSEADLAGLIRLGQGGRTVTETTFRCRGCGRPAEKQVRPPVPRTGGSVAYI